MNDLPIAANDRASDAADFGGGAASTRWVAIAVITAIWITTFVLFTVAQSMNAESKLGWLFIIPRAISCAAGAIISFGILAIQNRLRSSSLRARGVAALILAFAGTALLAGINYPIFLPFMPADQPASPVWLAYVWDFLPRLWIFATTSGIILALSYLNDIREREERINALQALAHSAQLRALRSQLNPHFLFNSLNSVTGLIASGDRGSAEAMIENLADFLRLSLALDPHRLITLGEELRLQELYLGVEQIRFPDRLSVTLDVPDELRGALVPSLITQPLIENSIKYAVAQSTSVVDLRIAATASGDSLELLVEDSGGNAASAAIKGGRFGLRNVAERLSAHFGSRSRIDAGPRPDGGFRNLIIMPLAVPVA